MLWLSGSEAAVGSFFPTVHIFGNPVRCARSGEILRRESPRPYVGSTSESKMQRKAESITIALIEL